MIYSPKVLEIISPLKSFLLQESTKLNFRTNSSDFSRSSGKLDFYNYALLGFSLLKNSLAVEVYNLLASNNLPSISKSAYSQARYKISYCFYQFLTTFLMQLVYTSTRNASEKGVCSDLPLKKWRGYYLEAIDGTGLQLAQTKELGAYFGYHTYGTGNKRKLRTVMAKCLVRVDLLNEYVLQSEVFKTSESERTICKKWLHQLHSTSLTIFDRGFCSAPIFSC